MSAVVMFALFGPVLPLPLAAQVPQSTAEDAACAALVAPAKVVFAEQPAWIASEGLPRFCRVGGMIDGRVEFEMRLPQKWSGRFMMAGCGGFCGELLPEKPGHSNSINEALKRGYAAISHDSGHQARSDDTAWAADSEALELWAYKVLPVVSEVGIELATSLYGQPPRYKYFSGCSNGGRLGLQAAQRFPELFDGIAAGAGIFDLSGNAGLWGNWLVTRNQAGGHSRVPRSKVPWITQFVMARCDAIDGRADGIIVDPRKCRVDFHEAVCPAGGPERANCVTADEAEVLNALHGGVRNGAGERVFPTPEPGSEYYSDVWLFGPDGQPAWGVAAAIGYRKMLAHDLSEPDQPAGLTTDQMIDWIRRSSVPAMTNAVDPDLSRLRKAGGKLLLYQGWSDPLVVPEPITHYYERAAQAAGGLRSLQDFARLYMVPGWGHCWEKPAAAPDDFDPLAELERWVEQGRAPEFLVARERDAAGAELRSRPVCAYPSAARLEKGADPRRYQSYQCVVPRKGEGARPTDKQFP